ncbi:MULTISPECIES: cupin domain-containing protein [unclassified Saccharothrix]|uniref:cupin domain-containing protein n=1 Tax=unclassified Saccharothrix TaxID=2593673 RepID=UPI00307E4E91
MITKFRIDESVAKEEFGLACQRLIPWPTDSDSAEEPPLGAMACFLRPGGSSLPDCHNQDEFMLILSGTGTLDLDGESASFEKGDLLVLPRNQEHVVHNGSDDENLVWVSLYWPLREVPLS